VSYSRFQFFPDIWNDDIQHNQKGILDTEALKERLNDDSISLYTIPLAFNFRPDLISNLFYGTGDLHWVITYINDINDSPEGYYTGRVIKVPTPKKVSEIV